MATTYTHNLVFRLGDGGKFIIAQVEFDKVEGIRLHRIVDSSDPLDVEVLEEFTAFLKKCEELFKKFEGAPTISLTEEAYTDPDLEIEVKEGSKLKKP